MSKIKDAFTKGKAFIPFISAGDHGIENTERYIRVMVKAGADMVEIGIPFSAPTAEGPVIQEASTRALSTGVKIHDIFDMVRRLRSGDDAVTVPLVFMTYLNPILPVAIALMFNGGLNLFSKPQLFFKGDRFRIFG